MNQVGNRADVSLAFVDVITNALGAMLVLFFVVALLQVQLEWPDSPEIAAPEDPLDFEPFVVIVRAEPPVLDSQTPPFRFEGFPNNIGVRGRGRTYDWGAGYAVAALDQPPPIGSGIYVQGTIAATELNVDFYHGGRKSLHRKTTLPTGGEVRIWPITIGD